MARPESSTPYVARIQGEGQDRFAEVARNAPAELIAGIDIPRGTALSILRSVASSSQTLAALPLSRRLAASFITTGLLPIDRLLSTGREGEDKVFMLNLISPPGGLRDRVALHALRETLQRDTACRVLVVDCNGHLSPGVLLSFFPTHEPERTRIDIVQAPTILALELCLVDIQRRLSASPATKLVVFSSLPGPPVVRQPTRQLLMRTMHSLATDRLTAVICTSSVQTHFPGGGTFDNARRPAVLRPQLREWLPPGSHEVYLVPDGRASGHAVLRTSPSGARRKSGSLEAFSLSKQGFIVDSP